MARTFFDPRDEASALRRAAILLERARQDGERDLEELAAGVAAIRRAAAAGRLVHRAALDRMAAALARVSLPFFARGASIAEIIRSNALMETCELLARLSQGIGARTDAAERASPKGARNTAARDLAVR